MFRQWQMPLVQKYHHGMSVYIHCFCMVEIMTKSDSPQIRMRSYIQMIATGPELSKPLSSAQAEDGLNLVISGEADPVQSAIFLIALRMKRETEAENIGALNALNRRCRKAVAEVDQVISLADPFNGFVRGLTAAPFLPAVFAACGLPAYIHGVRQAGPKYGITGHQILNAAGIPVLLSVKQAAECLTDSGQGWAYLDQSQYLPELHALIGLRDLMVKRSLVSTLEVTLKPLSGNRRTHLLTGFVHKAYPPIYAALARQAGFDSMAIVKGVEGGCIPSLSQVARYFSYHSAAELNLHKLSPEAVGIEQNQRTIPLEQPHQSVLKKTGFNKVDRLAPVAHRNLELGLQALAGKQGQMFDSLVYGASIGLVHTGISPSWSTAAALARDAILSGHALARFNAGRSVSTP